MIRTIWLHSPQWRPKGQFEFFGLCGTCNLFLLHSSLGPYRHYHDRFSQPISNHLFRTVRDLPPSSWGSHHLFQNYSVPSRSHYSSFLCLAHLLPSLVYHITISCVHHLAPQAIAAICSSFPALQPNAQIAFRYRLTCSPLLLPRAALHRGVVYNSFAPHTVNPILQCTYIKGNSSYLWLWLVWASDVGE